MYLNRDGAMSLSQFIRRKFNHFVPKKCKILRFLKNSKVWVTFVTVGRLYGWK